MCTFGNFCAPVLVPVRTVNKYDLAKEDEGHENG